MKSSLKKIFSSIFFLSFATAAPFRRHYYGTIGNIEKTRRFLRKDISTTNLRWNFENGEVQNKEFSASNIDAAISIRGGNSAMEMSKDSWDWCANLGAPAALVAGAVLATLSETREDLAPKRQDTRRVRFLKQFTRLLLLSAFAMELISIFATTVTGTILLANTDQAEGDTVSYASPMSFMHSNYIFEYLTARISFLQGLLNWLLAIALELSIPKEFEGEASRRMNVFISSCLITTIFLMLSFYNAHMNFYDNYFHMLVEYTKVVFKRYLKQWPPRIMSIFYVPSTLWTISAGIRAFTSDPDLDVE